MQIHKKQSIRMTADTINFGLDLEEMVKRAWRHSRPNSGPVNLWDILVIDAPVTEFAHMVIEIEAPILVREIIASWRDHTMWAQTSRVQELDNWHVYTKGMSDANLKRVENHFEQMHVMKDDNLRQDNYRLQLPLSYMTEFSIVVTWRSLVRMYNTFKELALVARDECVVAMFKETVKNFRRLIDGVLSSILDKPIGNPNEEPACLRLSAPSPLLELSSSSYGTAHSNQGVITLTTRVPLALRAQLVRHRYIHVMDDLFSFISNHLMLSSDHLATNIVMTASAPRAIWLELYKKRSCWIAQANLWSPLLQVLRHVLDIEDQTKLLPCANGVCSVQEDALQRVKGNDPGVPCPRHLKLHAPDCFQPTSALKENMLSVVRASGSDAKTREFWHDHINALERKAQ